MQDLSHRRITPKELEARGWVKVRGYRTYQHRNGWLIQHCGHPTALWPYALYDPEGQMILTGAAFGYPRDHGRAWPSIAAAVDYVAELLGRK